ncbi:hypothetical protein [Microbacterium sp. JAI119]|uniref:hypothetical protein n=1 Tax=Microbacterium sp. JAI119 TaxID=2723062 RepID=UPI0015CCB337|nr:hypothetical protein [Microbacterium sp. JAI119]NYF29237.1 hypothetical protein [Microbacterium sp. JAI119]
MAEWLTADDEDLPTLWPDVPMNDDAATLYLNAAKEACLAYAPALAEGASIPDGWRLAQALQARNTYNSSKAAPGGDFDGGGYGISAFPLDWQVKQLLRPRRALGAIA